MEILVVICYNKKRSIYLKKKIKKFSCCVFGTRVLYYYYMYNKFKEGLIGNNAYLNWKAYIKKVASVCTYRRVDNTMDDKANLKDMDKHRQLESVLYVRLGMSILKQANG